MHRVFAFIDPSAYRVAFFEEKLAAGKVFVYENSLLFETKKIQFGLEGRYPLVIILKKTLNFAAELPHARANLLYCKKRTIFSKNERISSDFLIPP